MRRTQPSEVGYRLRPRLATLALLTVACLAVVFYAERQPFAVHAADVEQAEGAAAKLPSALPLNARGDPQAQGVTASAEPA